MLPDFFIRLDQECGPLTLHSSLKDLVNYTRKGLDCIEHDRQSAAAAAAATSSELLLAGSGSGAALTSADTFR